MHKLILFSSSPTFSSDRGLRIGRITVKKDNYEELFSGDIFIEKHQGKHAEGDWNYGGKKGSTFKPSVASKSNIDLFRVIVKKMFWMDAVRTNIGVDKYFNFSFIDDMTKRQNDNTTGVHVQASFSENNGDGFFEFHCYPDKNALLNNPIIIDKTEYSNILKGLRYG